MAVLWVTISRVCDESRPAVLSALARFGAEQAEDNRVRMQETEAGQVMTVLQKALADSGYVAVENIQDASEIAVLKEGDIEQLGLYLCGYCAMVFGNDVERNLHQRVHYFGFG